MASKQQEHVLPIGARVLVDGVDEAIVKAAFPEGSSSYLFPHYKVAFVGGGAERVTVAMSRVGVVRKNGGDMFAVDLHYIAGPGKSVVARGLEEAMQVVTSEAGFTQAAANDERILWTPGHGRLRGSWRVRDSAKSLVIDPVAKTIVLRHAAGATPILHLIFTGHGHWAVDFAKAR